MLTSSLLLAIEKKEEPLLMHIYSHYRNDMYRIAKSIVHDKYLAEDVVQEAFKRIIEKDYLIKRVNRNALRSYVVLITRSIACNLIHKEHKYQVDNLERNESPSTDQISIDEIIIQKETIQMITIELDRIGINYSAPMILRYYFGFTDRETAEILNINSPGTVRSLCSRGRHLILDNIKKAEKLNE